MASPVRLQRPSNLALDAGKPKSRVTFNEECLSSQRRSTSTTTPSPRKLKYDSDFRAKRKRAHSCSFYWDHFSKRRKAAGAIVLPTKFLLGGNITDPLNLEALDKGDDIVEKTEETINASYKRSTTVRVIIPPNINDPLNLDACSEDGEEQLADAISRQRRRRKTKKRRRRNSEPGGLHMFPETQKKRLYTSLDDTHTPRRKIDSDLATLQSNAPDILKTSVAISDVSDAKPTTSSAPVSVPVTPTAPVLTSDKIESSSTKDSSKEPSPVNTAVQGTFQQQSVSATPRYVQAKKQRTKSEDKIVSPVVPQPGVERKRHFSHQRHPSVDKSLNPKQIDNRKNQRFQYGNYNQYYGYRNVAHKTDPRLKLLDKEWFEGKEVLDIGCNIGHITLSIGREFAPQRIVGIDIDKKLVKIAQKNVRHYVDSVTEGKDEFPSSMKLLYGSLRPSVNKGGQRIFPHNVKFYQSNYVLENDALLEIVRPEFDVILCLSVTKWIHLNWGDNGLKRFFKRIFRNLKPGGMLILEPQSWPSYTKKKKLTNEIFENYKKIQFFPNQFGEFLTSDVGFTHLLKCSVSHFSRGFDRPVYIYKKTTPESAASEESEITHQSNSNAQLAEVPANTSPNVQSSSKESDVTEAQTSESAVDCSTLLSSESQSLSSSCVIAPVVLPDAPSSEESQVADHDTEVTEKDNRTEGDRNLSEKNNKVVSVNDPNATVQEFCETPESTLSEKQSGQEELLESPSEKQS